MKIFLAIFVGIPVAAISTFFWIVVLVFITEVLDEKNPA